MEEVFMANSSSKSSKTKKKTSKKVTKKPVKATKKTPVRKKKTAKTTRKTHRKVIDPALRQKMIEETAYFNAQQRGFISGGALDDWLAAENEVDIKLIKQ